MKILVVEDDSMHVNYLNEIIESAIPEVTGILIAEDGQSGEVMAREQNVLCVVMDLRMKNGNGIEAARSIWSERPNTRILFWSNYSDEAYLRGIAQIVPEQAAYGYVLKTASAARMRLSLRSVLIEAQILIDPEVHQQQYRHDRSPSALTDIELDILTDVALGLPDKIIAERRNVSVRTVQNRLLAMYDKLNADRLEVSPEAWALNKRVRAVSQAIKDQIINVESLDMAEKELKRWICANKSA